jgi:hypothetical protein
VSTWSCAGSADREGPEGEWSLVAVDAVGVPASVGPDAAIVGGDLQIFPDHSFWRRTRASIGGAVFQDWQDGGWSVDGRRLELSVSGATASTIGAWNGESLDLQAGRTLHYVRSRSSRVPLSAVAP